MKHTEGTFFVRQQKSQDAVSQYKLSVLDGLTLGILLHWYSASLLNIIIWEYISDFQQKCRV